MSRSMIRIARGRDELVSSAFAWIEEELPLVPNFILIACWGDRS